MNRFTIEDAKATLKKHRAKLGYGRFGFFTGPTGKGVVREGCAVACFVLHATQDAEKTRDILKDACRPQAGDSHLDMHEYEVFAEVCGTSRSYLLGLETGFENPERTAHYALDDVDGRLGHQDGKALRDLVK